MTNAADSDAESQSGAKSHSGAVRWLPQRGRGSTLETLPYDFGVCDQISATKSAESVAEIQWQTVVAWAWRSSVVEALPDYFEFYDRISATSSAASLSHRESVVQSQRFGRSIAERCLPEWEECRTLEALFYDFGLWDQHSLTHLAESDAERPSPERG